jgi:hypothetical protein
VGTALGRGLEGSSEGELTLKKTIELRRLVLTLWEPWELIRL